MDTLNKVLNALSFSSSFYYSVRFDGVWGVKIPQFKNVSRFHICCTGKCCFKISGLDKLIELLPGDMLIIPHGASHTLLDSPDTPVIDLDDVFIRTNYNGSKVFEYGSQEGETFSELLCGHFEFVNTLEHPLIKQLPPFILLRRPQYNEFKWLRDALVEHTHENMLDKSANQTIINRLSEIVFTLAVQKWQEEQQGSDGFLAAIADPQLSKAIRAFHHNSEQRWTIEELASQAFMSRTQFVERFTNLVKMPPIQYITLWRMTNAQKLLRDSNESIQNIANRSGYKSITAFSKAFKRYTNQAPGEYRKAFKENLITTK